jgi:hypothetical protein
MRLSQIIDPRGPLEKARLSELQAFAKEEGVAYDPWMGAQVIRELLKAAGKTNISPPPRALGFSQPNPSPGSHRSNQTQPVPEKAGPDVDWAKELVRQQANQAPPVERKMSITELRQACKAKGIKIARTDNTAALKAKLDGE